MWIKVNGTVRDMMKYLDGQAFTQRMEACRISKRVQEYLADVSELGTLACLFRK